MRCDWSTEPFGCSSRSRNANALQCPSFHHEQQKGKWKKKCRPTPTPSTGTRALHPIFRNRPCINYLFVGQDFSRNRNKKEQTNVRFHLMHIHTRVHVYISKSVQKYSRTPQSFPVPLRVPLLRYASHASSFLNHYTVFTRVIQYFPPASNLRIQRRNPPERKWHFA